MRRINLLLAAVITASAGLMATPTSPSHAADRDCGDFANQRDAQIFFLNNGGPNNDPHGLDAEGDGIACESNPCPCYTGKTPPGGNDQGTTGGKTIHQRGRIIRVIDGDTVEVRLNTGRKADVRVLGIDTPEVYGGTECWGPQASKATKQMLPRGTRVALTSDSTQTAKDRYGRLLRYVQKGKVDVGRRLVLRGHAEVYVYGGKAFKRVRAYRGAQAQARSADRGLWGAC